MRTDRTLPCSLHPIRERWVEREQRDGTRDAILVCRLFTVCFGASEQLANRSQRIVFNIELIQLQRSYMFKGNGHFAE